MPSKKHTFNETFKNEADKCEPPLKKIKIIENKTKAIQRDIPINFDNGPSILTYEFDTNIKKAIHESAIPLNYSFDIDEEIERYSRLINKQKLAVKIKKCQDNIDIDSENKLIQYALQNKDLFIVISHYLSIEEIFPICVYLDKIKFVSESPLFNQIMLKQIFGAIKEIRDNPESNMDNIAYLLLNNCLNGGKSPFQFACKSRKRCILLKEIFKTEACKFSINNELKKINYFDYLFFGMKAYYLFALLIPDSILLHYINIFASFSHIKIKDLAIYNVRLQEFKTSMEYENDVSKPIEAIFSKLWINYPQNSINERLRFIPMRSFASNFANMYHFREFYRLIDWNYFFVAGGSLLSILFGTYSSGSDIDIFSHKLSIKEFHNFLLDFQEKMMEHGWSYQMNRLTPYITTFLLFRHTFGPIFYIKIQFIWTCEKSTIAQILLSFDLGASQIALIPNTKRFSNSRLLCTDSFRYFYNTGKCIVFKLNLKRIQKYKQKGVEKFLIASDDELNSLKELEKIDESDESEDYDIERSMKLTINDGSPIILSTISYNDVMQQGHCYPRNCNCDEQRLFFKFATSLLQ